MKKSTKRNIVTIVTLIMIIIGGLAILRVSATVVSTATKLTMYHLEISDYNDSIRKTDRMTAEIEDVFAARNELYNSDDTVVKVYSNLNFMFKFIGALVALGNFILVPFVFLANVVNFFDTLKRQHQKELKRKKMEQEQKQQLHLVRRSAQHHIA